MNRIVTRLAVAVLAGSLCGLAAPAFAERAATAPATA